MTTRLNPYLGFRDNARQAIEFYHGVFGGELSVSTFGDSQTTDDPAEADKIMHAMLETSEGMVLMAADTPNGMHFAAGTNYSVSLSGDDEATLRRHWERLSADGAVIVPLERAPWGDQFGMCTDQFGVTWMVNIAGGSD